MKNSITTCFWRLLTALLLMSCGQAVSAQNWAALNGVTAQDISIGKNGKIWMTSKDHFIYRWDGSTFEKIEGQAQQVAVDPNGNAWVVQASGAIYRFNPNVAYPGSWTQMPGNAKSLAIGANGSIWRIGTDVAGGGYGIYRWNGSTWDNIPGGAVQIAVDAAGHAWVVQANGATWTYNPANNGPADTWVNMQVLSKNISIGADGAVWRIGTDQGPEGFGIYKWGGASSWTKVAGSAVRVAGDASGNLWGVNTNNVVYRPGQATVATNTTPVTTPAVVTTPTTVVTPPIAAPQKGLIYLKNVGNYSVTVFKTTAGNMKDSIANISPDGRSAVNATVGDRYTVQFEDPTIRHRAIYIYNVSDEPEYFIYANVPMKDFGGYGMNIGNTSIEDNLYGVDTAYFGRQGIATSPKKKQIFERLNPIIGTDYTIDGGIIMKAGFSNRNHGKVYSTNGSRMSYGFSSFSDGWSLGLSGSFPVKGVDVAGGFGYSQSQKTQSNSTDVYVYTRYQNVTHEVSVTPSKAYLDAEFVSRIRRLKTAADATNLIMEYGTHYPSVVYYGGDLSSYLKMNSEQFMKATSMSIDLQIEVSKSSPAEKTKDVMSHTNKGGTTLSNTKETKTPGGSAGGKLSFGYSQDTEEGRLLENTESAFKISGGEYTMNGDYVVKRETAVPLVTVLRRIDELITPEVIKDDIDPAQIARAQSLVKRTIQYYINQLASKQPVKLPPPVIYEVTLDKMQIPWQMDDANHNTKGSIEAIAFSDVAQTTRLPATAGKLWEQKEYSLDFRFSPYNEKTFVNAKQKLIHYPDPATGRFNPFYMNVTGTIQEKDDNLIYPDGAILRGQLGITDIHSLNLQPGGPAVTRTFEITAANEGIIKVTVSIKKMVNHFDSPGNLNQIIGGQAN